MGEAKRTLEAGDKFCWVGAFSSREHAAPAPTFVFEPQGVRCAAAKKIILPRYARSGIFPAPPLDPQRQPSHPAALWLWFFFTYPKIRSPSSFVARMAETVARAAAKVVT